MSETECNRCGGIMNDNEFLGAHALYLDCIDHMKSRIAELEAVQPVYGEITHRNELKVDGLSELPQYINAVVISQEMYDEYMKLKKDKNTP